MGRRAIRIVVGTAVLVVLAGVAIAAQIGDSGRIGPKLHTTGNGRRLIAPGQFVTLGHFPTGGALTADGRFYWTVSTGRAQNDVRIVDVALKHPRSFRRCRSPAPQGESPSTASTDSRTSPAWLTRPTPTRCEPTYAGAAAM